MRTTTLRQPWWSILEGGKLHTHTFTRPSTQLRHKVKHALLRSPNSLSDADTLLLMSAHYATNHTRAHILREKALAIRLSPIAATMRHVN